MSKRRTSKAALVELVSQILVDCPSYEGESCEEMSGEDWDHLGDEYRMILGSAAFREAARIAGYSWARTALQGKVAR